MPYVTHDTMLTQVGLNIIQWEKDHMAKPATQPELIPLEKPQPKGDLVITYDGQFLRIFAANAKVAAWVDSEAPVFGVLSDLQYQGVYKAYLLQVSPFYDADSVAAWLKHVVKDK